MWYDEGDGRWVSMDPIWYVAVVSKLALTKDIKTSKIR